MAETTAERVTRLLALVAYLRDRPGVPVAEVAEHFGTTEAQVLSDVNLLWVSGTPGYLPDDLIDFNADALDHGVLTLTEAQGMDRPLRLATAEAVALLLALRSMRELVAARPEVGGDQAGVLGSAIDKLAAATGRAADQAASVHVDLGAQVVPETLARLRHAVGERRRVHLRYVSAADVVTERDVDPVELRSDGATWSLHGWCHRAGGPRTFRLDRILAVDVLDTPAEEHDLAGAEVPVWDAGGRLVTLELASRARWVAERVPVEQVTDLPDGSMRVVLRAGDPAWLANLLLSLGDAVRSVDPSDVAQEVAGRARAALRSYEDLG